MRKVLLTVVSAALMGASTLSGAVVPNAFAQGAVYTVADADAAAAQVQAQCQVSEAACRAILEQLGTILVSLRAQGLIDDTVRNAYLDQAYTSADRPTLTAAIESELFPEGRGGTAATGGPGAGGITPTETSPGDGGGSAPVTASPT